MAKHPYTLRPDEPDERDFLYSAGKLKAVNLPAGVDLRVSCPPVYDQGVQGSCTSHAGCACRTMLTGDKSLDLSRSYLYYQERVLSNSTDKDSGASMRDICKALQNYGVCKSELMPYNQSDYTTQPSDEAQKGAEQYKIASYSRISDRQSLKQTIVSRQQPVLIGMQVYESMESEQVAQSGILPMPQAGEKLLGSHAVLAVGYCDNKILNPFMQFFYYLTGKKVDGYFIVRNSWGENWGQKGYFQMPYAYFDKYGFDFWQIE